MHVRETAPPTNEPHEFTDQMSLGGDVSIRRHRMVDARRSSPFDLLALGDGKSEQKALAPTYRSQCC